MQLHIVYQLGQHNNAADALSHISHSAGIRDSTSTVPHGVQFLDNPVVAAEFKAWLAAVAP